MKSMLYLADIFPKNMEFRFLNGRISMINYKIRQTWREFSQNRIVDKALSMRSIKKDRQAQVIGLMGEMCFGRYLIDNEVDFDYLANQSMDFDFESNGIFIDVKTAYSKYTPKPDWHCRIPCYQDFQRTDMYVFAGATDSEVYLYGWISKHEFWFVDKTWQENEGDIDPATGVMHQVDCRKIKIADLKPMDDLVTFLAHQGDAH